MSATPSLSERRLIDLQLLNRPEDKEELDLLAECVADKSTGWLKSYEARRKEELKRQSIANYRLQVRLSKLR